MDLYTYLSHICEALALHRHLLKESKKFSQPNKMINSTMWPGIINCAQFPLHVNMFVVSEFLL